MKNPFKKSSIVDTITSVGLGGAANVAVDYAVENVSFLSGMTDKTVNIVKIVFGAVGGSMTSNKYLRAVTDGLATVGAANLIKSFITPEQSGGGDQAGSGYAPFIGGSHRKMGNRKFREVGTVPFMS